MTISKVDVMPFMWAHWLCQCAQTSAAVLLAGTAALRLLAWGPGGERSSIWNPLCLTSWSVLLGTAVLQLWLTAADMSGLPLMRACSGQVLKTVLGSTIFGAVWKVRLCLLAATLVVGLGIGATWRAEGRTRLSAVLEVAAALLTAALLATLVWSGHAHASDKHAWLLPTDLLHVMAAGAWPGGLLPLVLLLEQARRDPTVVPIAVTITRRFSVMSLTAVGALAFSGLLNSYGLVGTFSAFWRSPYGRLLVVKAGLFAAMICLGAINRKSILRAGIENPGRVVRRLWRNTIWECILAIGVLLATEALAMNAPPSGG